ncbi:hypothetical protein ABUW04_03715 [Streptacidiphilus sp. N1-10]|uniref:Uncharacterized protein n=1 Tax=Streptacidiphilus jeojiensis TaxID=3229225 RepID=A0ABV6XGR6_9ACTN
MMRDLIAAFSTATRDRMTGAEWRKRTGDIYTHDLGDGFHAWVGLNRASKQYPLKINPVVGLRYDPLERLLADITGARSQTAATIAQSVGYLTPGNSFLQLQVTEPDDAGQVADELHDLVETYGLPFARQHANTDALLTALRAGGNVPNPDRARLLIPALHFLRGATDETRAGLAQGLAHYGQSTSMPVVAEYHRFANALTTRLPA